MDFFSLEFAGSFVIFFILYWLCQKNIKMQNVLLIAASYLFIALFNIKFLLILVVYSLLIYLLANVFAQYKYTSARMTYNLFLFVIIVLFVAFKYYSFLQESVQQGFERFGLHVDLPVLELLTPLGMSFYIFHSVSYVVSVQKKEIKPAPLADLLLYLCFFPSIVAGPINRAKDLLPQIQASGRALLQPSRAIALIAFALAKLFLFSAFLSEHYVNPVFDSPANFSAAQVLLAIYAYAWQIYFNFSGYTNLVTGLALLLGFAVPQNFNSPYLAENLRLFWRRWHISLSLFIRDYIYIPLGGNKRGVIRKNINMFIAMVISGLWHGAGINFLLWGALHGLGLIGLEIKDRFFPAREGNPFTRLAARLITFHYVCFAWVFFRSSTIDDALLMLKQLFSGSWRVGWSQESALLALAGLLFLCYPQLVTFKRFLAETQQRIPWFIYPIPLVLFLMMVFIFAPSGIPGFIYANF
ncbi:MBOAT family protein [Affinibrenneria salicis]|uniref:Probable alginate O-acetylase n=1 Tax=Affinibrenneria salicis TaxID=2590031 RepID=A0A5J5G809_9GAMM|nr:MBOAT family O-acyltransferase [Affinibrenneria salicis]KAA9002538.1 MBOAT family protein [Affinibrenneria salicis]KAA9003174.1 MBOAT family protein [Affinibrenneria salicis]